MSLTGMDGISNTANINSVINSVTQPAKTSRFRQIVGGVVGSVGNVVMPGVGGAIGGLISGNPGTGSLLGSESYQFLQYQAAMTAEMRQFELVSTVLKNRHDSSMAAIRNMKS